MKILFYGPLADAIGPEIELDIAEQCRVADLRERLAAHCPDAANIPASSR